MKRIYEGMLLYHGSYCAVEKPDLQKCALRKDFGRGFYLTSSKEQARAFAKISSVKAKARGLLSHSARFGYVSAFKFSPAEPLDIFDFETAGIDWLHCIVAHRRGGVFLDAYNSMQGFDVVSGKIANDDTNATIVAYMGNVFGEMGSERADRMCISLLLPERLQDQFCFRSDKAVRSLAFLQSEKVALE